MVSLSVKNGYKENWRKSYNSIGFLLVLNCDDILGHVFIKFEDGNRCR